MEDSEESPAVYAIPLLVAHAFMDNEPNMRCRARSESCSHTLLVPGVSQINLSHDM